MANSDLNIITSPEAKRMLQMVTKDFYNHSPAGLWYFEVVGRKYDQMAQWANNLKYEIFPQTCTWSIAVWEWLYGFEPDDTLTLQLRRQRIMTKITGRAPMNPEVIRRNVAAITGADVEIFENVAPYTFLVLIRPTGNDVNFLDVKRYIREAKPAHLAFVRRA